MEDVHRMLAKWVHTLTARYMAGYKGVVLASMAGGGGANVEVWAQHVDIQLDRLQGFAHSHMMVPADNTCQLQSHLRVILVHAMCHHAQQHRSNPHPSLFLCFVTSTADLVGCLQ